MDLGFETIGNASIIAHDNGPVIATDPWFEGAAYFGSWVLSHAVPDEQKGHFKAAPYIWVSHGHPDHLNLPCLEQLRGQKLLLPDHFGGRIAGDLRGMGFDVTVLKNGEWFQVSERVKVCCCADWNQDSMLLLDIGGHLVINANDANARGQQVLLQREIPKYGDKTFLLWLTGWGDADMINFWREDGTRILPAAAAKEPVGPVINEVLDMFGIRRFVPSSSMHEYGRTDSGWANEYVTPLEAHSEGFVPGNTEILPAFLSYDLATHEYRTIDPPRNPIDLRPPEEFGDSWSDELEVSDVQKLRDYLTPVEHLHTFLGYVRFRVGGVEHVIDISPEHKGVGVTFEAPRGSLMQCVDWNAFDDMLIGNYMKTTLHGDWGVEHGAEALYPNFTPFLTKVADNGQCRTREEVRRYFCAYRDGGYFDFGPGPMGQRFKAALESYL